MPLHEARIRDVEAMARETKAKERKNKPIPKKPMQPADSPQMKKR